MNIETVNELIASLEAAGELSIRETKVMALAKAFKQLAAENVALALENVAMKQIVDSVTNLDNEPQYHAEGMGCGLEDRGITDRYDACRYGWDEAMERVYGEVIPCADELDFSATDRIVAGIKADAAAPLVSALKVIANSEQHNGDTVVCDFETLISVAACALRDYYAQQLREGADK
ncbi:hypothetical protein [Escherichia coli]|uniref:hypothetical protein n=1 Tax=Escherichia coli TaxID=562 RepID=UPI0018A31FA9|nr:hypothetical protein [Escherichia coli]MBF7866736.1 hypothetical protein [Escherichia coli]MCM5712154.1 hypothetical protein [Escherichia coli]HCA6307455.1 hypothetical protein [Escherichia coli]HDE2976624.1 hypothetical protein [Escherichia coli]